MFLLVCSWWHRYLTLAFPRLDSCMVARNLRRFLCPSAHQPVCYSFGLFWWGEEAFFLPVLHGAADMGRDIFCSIWKILMLQQRSKPLSRTRYQDGTCWTERTRYLSSEHALYLGACGLNSWVKLTPLGSASLLIASPVLPGDLFLCRNFSTLRQKSCLSWFTLDSIWLASYMRFWAITLVPG